MRGPEPAKQILQWHLYPTTSTCYIWGKKHRRVTCFMSDGSFKSGDMEAFLAALKGISAARVVEFGTNENSCLELLVASVDWTDKVELHCVPSFESNGAEDAFDSVLTRSAERSEVQFNLTKHLGTETEVNDAVMNLAEASQYDAAYIASSRSPEELLTTLLVCNEALRSKGVLAIADAGEVSTSLGVALNSFKEMFSDMYTEIGRQIFVKS